MRVGGRSRGRDEDEGEESEGVVGEEAEDDGNVEEDVSDEEKVRPMAIQAWYADDSQLRLLADWQCCGGGAMFSLASAQATGTTATLAKRTW